MKCNPFLRLFLVFLLTFTQQHYALSLKPSSPEAERVIALNTASRELFSEHLSVLKFFRTLMAEEAHVLNTVLQHNYAAGYYSEVLKLCDDEHYAEASALLLESEEQLRMLKSGTIYRSVLRRAQGGDIVHLTRFIVGRREAGIFHGNTVAVATWVFGTEKEYGVQLEVGSDAYWGALFFGGVYAHIRGQQYRLEPKEVFPPYMQEAPKPTVTPSKLFDLSHVGAAEVSKVFFVALLSLLSVAIIVGLIGTRYFPHVFVFRRVRVLLEA